MMKVSNDFYIECNECGNVILIKVDDLDYETYGYDRPMGEEIEYDYSGEICCDGCSSWINVSIRGYEYPIGAFNFSDFECHGGRFIDEPSVEMDYEFDPEYYSEAYAEYEKAEYYLEYNREKIKRMSPRDFEFFVADIFEELGFSVKVTQQTRDGGKDIIATKATPIPYTLIIECKHWDANRKVNVSVVRSVYGVQVARQANQSIIVTSSGFTKDARDFAEERQNLMTLWDMDDLLRLIMNK